MASHALITPAPPSAVGAPTYVALLSLAQERAYAATMSGSGPFLDAAHAAAEVMGYERFLAVVGRHLRLIGTPEAARGTGHDGSRPPLNELIRRLSDLHLAPSSDGSWGRAADTLATAHDLLATHVGPYGETRTPDGHLLDEPGIREAAVNRVLALVDEPLRVRRHLLAAASSASRGTGASTRATNAHVRQATDAIADVLARYRATSASAYDVSALDELDELPPALPSLTTAERTRSDDPFAALRWLRLLSYRQARGSVPASAASLHDLARLAHLVSADADRWLPRPETPLDRVRRASAMDQLSAASDAWATTAAVLQRHIQGLSKAPRAYADSLQVVESAHTTDAVRRAVLAALPRLGRDAANTAAQLARTGCLATPTREPGKLRASWRLVSPEEAETLSARFTRAGQASRTAWDSVSLLTHDTRRPARRIDDPQRLAVRDITVGGRRA